MTEKYIDPDQVGKLNYQELYKTNPELTKKLVKELLNSGLVRVHFKKVNGEFRDMECTTDARFIPQEPVVENKVPKIIRKENEGVCRVFDVNKKEWRSFKWENLLNVIQPWAGEKIYTSSFSDETLNKVLHFTDNLATKINDK